MTKEANDIYKKAREQFEAKKEAVEVDEKNEFIKNEKKPKKHLHMFVLGIIVLGGAYLYSQMAGGDKEEKKTKDQGGLVNIIGDAPKVRNNEYIEKPDMPLPDNDDKKIVLTQLPPLPDTAEEKSEWYLRKMTTNKSSEFSSTNEKANQNNKSNSSRAGSNNSSNSKAITSADFDGGGTDLEDMLSPTVTASVKAQVLPNRDYLMTKGTSIDCTLINAIDTSVEGFVTCRTAHDVYSDSGRVLLVERGSKIVGEYKQMGRNMGEPRLFILWSRLTTPYGVAIDLNSAGTDSLGRAGVDGDVNQFWFKRFGSAFLTSIMQDSLQILNSEINRNRSSEGVQISTDNTMNQSEKLVEELLAQNRGIMPKLVKNQGESVRIFVSRDINFDEVYQLKGVK